MPRPHRPLLWLAGLFTFLFPVAGFLGLLISTDRETGTRRDASNRQNLEQIVDNAARSSQPLPFFSDFSRRLLRRLQWEGDLVLAPGIEASGGIRVFAFSERGNRLAIPGTTSGFLYASEQTWNCLVRLE